jgi:RNA polymerase sigma-70 factor (ECF subfamily)
VATAPSIGRGDRDSAATTTNELYRRFGGPIFGYCLSQLRSREEAEDAVQQTFLNALRGLQRGTETRAEQAWLFKIAHNVCNARRMSSGRRLRLETPNDFEVLQEIIPSPTRGDALELIGIEDALEAMPENQRRAILMREWQGLSYREIASELRLSQSSVEMLIFRARRTLAAALEKPEFPKTQLARLRNTVGVGPLIAAIKSFLAGGVAVKTVAVTVAVGTVGVTATELEHHRLMAKHPRAVAAAMTRVRLPAHARLGSTAGSLLTAGAVARARDGGAGLEVFAARRVGGGVQAVAGVFTSVARIAPEAAAQPTVLVEASAPPVAVHDRQGGNADSAAQPAAVQQPSPQPASPQQAAPQQAAPQPSSAPQPSVQQPVSQPAADRSKPAPANGGGNDDGGGDHTKTAPAPGGGSDAKQQEHAKTTSSDEHGGDKHDGGHQGILSAQTSAPVVPTQPLTAQPQAAPPQPALPQPAPPQPAVTQPAVPQVTPPVVSAPTQQQNPPAERETHGNGNNRGGQGDHGSKGKGGEGKGRDEGDDQG